MSVMLVVVLVLGYVVIWAIWRFFFKGRTLPPPDYPPPPDPPGRQP
jgi:hypothetical protein